VNRSSDINRSSGERTVQVRSPLLWVLLPLMGGYAAGLWLPSVPVSFLVGAALLAGSGAVWFSQSSCGRVIGWHVFFCVAVFSGSWAWWLERVPAVPAEWEVLPAREVEVQMVVTRVFRASDDGRYWRGVGTLISADPLVAELVGQSVVYSVRGTEEGMVPVAGARLYLRGVISRLDNDDPFDRLWESQQVFFRLRQGQLLASPDRGPSWRQWAAAERSRWAEILSRSGPEQQRLAGVLGAMMLGDRALLDPLLQEQFLLSGTMHLFAVSGLHVMAVGGALFGLASLLPLPRSVRTWVALIFLGVYVGVIGLPPSAIRAYAMLVFYCVGRGLTRRTAPFPAVVASAVVLLIWDPRQLLGLGFQLSYTVVAAILLLGLPLGNTVESWFRSRSVMRVEMPGIWNQRLADLRRYVVQVCAISLAASAASAPLVVRHFEVFTPGAVLLNPLLVPVAGLVVVDGVIVLLLGLLGLEGLSQFFAQGAWVLIAGMELVVQGALWLPGMFGHRGWVQAASGLWLTLAFLWLSLCMHFRTMIPRWPPLVRFALPIVVVLVVLMWGTQRLS